MLNPNQKGRLVHRAGRLLVRVPAPGFQQLEPIAERIEHVEAIEAFQGLVRYRREPGR